MGDMLMDLFDKRKYLPKEEIERLEKEEASINFSESYVGMQHSITRVSKTDLKKDFWISLWELISTKIFGFFKPKKEQSSEQLNQSSEAMDKISQHFDKQKQKSKTEKEIFKETSNTLKRNEK